LFVPPREGWLCGHSFTPSVNASKTSVFWDVSPVMALMMEAAGTFVTSVNVYQTTLRNIPDDSHQNIRRREKPKSESEYLKRRPPHSSELNYANI
jgi:hypothetical protein